MERGTNRSIWQRMKKGLRELKEEMYKNSVANAGPSDEACCHKPVEELEREREKYRIIAKQRNSNSNP